MLFLRIFQHLLPDAEAWRLTAAKKLRKLFEGIAVVFQGTPEGADVESAVDFVDLVYLDAFPETTRALNEWERHYGLPITDTTSEPAVVAARLTLAAEWAATGGQSPSYIQGVLHAAGFTDVFVHEWWDEVGDTRDPRVYTNVPLVGIYQCTGEDPPGTPLPSQPQCSPFASQPQCNKFLANDIQYLVNKDLTRRAPPPVPDDPTTWPYFMYVAWTTFPEHGLIDAERRTEFERLLLKLRPVHNWVVTIVVYGLPSGTDLTTEDGDDLTTEDGDDLTT